MFSKYLLPTVTLALLSGSACIAQGNTPAPPLPPLQNLGSGSYSNTAPGSFTLAIPRDKNGHGGPMKSFTMRTPDDIGSGSFMGIVPPGTWWRNPETIKNINLSPDQQKKMDDIFRQNKIQLIHMRASLEEEQVNLEPMLNSNPPDQGKTLAEISRIADLRADLEKANARMLLALRGVLSSEQWTKLQADRSDQIKFLRMQPGAAAPGPFSSHQHSSTTTTTCITKDGQTTPTCTTTHGGPGGSSSNFQINMPDANKIMMGAMPDLSSLRIPAIPDLSNLTDIPAIVIVDAESDSDLQ